MVNGPKRFKAEGKVFTFWTDALLYISILTHIALLSNREFHGRAAMRRLSCQKTKLNSGWYT